VRLVELLATKPLLVGDGAMGTRLMERGLVTGTCGELWNLEAPEVIEQIQREYAEAGADYLLTNTFGGNPVALARHGVEDRMADVNRAAVEIARRAGSGGALVFGDIGPTGELLEPYGSLTEERARQAFGQQAAALAEAGVDAIICETFESAAELRLALLAARERADLPLIASMKFSPEPSGRYRSMMGDGPAQLAEVAAECGCAVAGTNCGQGIATMPALVAELARLLDVPVIAQPNAGVPQLVEGRTVYPEEPSAFERVVPELYRAGARIIGGCCGTTAEHIRVIRSFADSL